MNIEKKENKRFTPKTVGLAAAGVLAVVAATMYGGSLFDGAPDAPAAAIEAPVPVAVPPTAVPPVPTEDLCPHGFPEDFDSCPDDWGVVYLMAEADGFYRELVGKNANGFPIFAKSAIPFSAGDVIVVFNTWNDVSYSYGFNALSNAQGWVCDANGENCAKEAPGLWRGDGGGFYFERAGLYGAGIFVAGADVLVPECYDLWLKYPESCDQGIGADANFLGDLE